MIKIASLWSIVSGLLYILLAWVSTDKRVELNAYPEWQLINTSLYVIIIGCTVFFAMRNTRNVLYKNSGINYAQTFYIGVFTSVMTGLIFGLYSLIYIKFLNPELTTELIKETTIKMIELKKPSEEITKAVEDIRGLFEPKMQFISNLVNITVLGMICTALLAIFVRNRDTFSTQQP